jgi:hypothetical protein
VKLSARTKRGLIILISVFSGLISFWLSLILIALGAMLIAQGQYPEATEKFLSDIPFGKNFLAGLSKFESFLP